MTHDWLLYIAFSVAAGVFASRWRNRSGFGWFFLALIITPLLAFIFWAIPAAQTRPDRLINLLSGRDRKEIPWLEPRQ